MILGCNLQKYLGDGIYDKLSNSEVIEVVWDTFKRDKGSFSNVH